jgi:hypothetical protein
MEGRLLIVAEKTPDGGETPVGWIIMHINHDLIKHIRQFHTEKKTENTLTQFFGVSH